MFESQEKNNGVGPGYYNIQSPDKDILKRSHNIRTQVPKSPRQSGDLSASGLRLSGTMRSSPGSPRAYDPVEEVKRNFSQQSYAMDAYDTPKF